MGKHNNQTNAMARTGDAEPPFIFKGNAIK